MQKLTSRLSPTAARGCSLPLITLWRNTSAMNPACMTLHFSNGAKTIYLRKLLPENDSLTKTKCPGLHARAFGFGRKFNLEHVPQELIVNVVVVLDFGSFYK